MVNSVIAQVLLYKDEINISQAIIKTKKEGKLEHHSLTFPSMSESEYGNYSCLETNSNLGTATDFYFSQVENKTRILSFKCPPYQEVLTNQE
jgi:hypothetical protein